MIYGKLAHAKVQEPLPFLELEGHVLPNGHALDIVVQGHWIEGQIEYSGRFGWLLHTNFDTDPTVLLHPGVLARIDERW